MFQPVNKDKSINYLVPSSDNIYVDLVIASSDTNKTASNSYYKVIRNNLILPKASDYYATLDSCEIPSEFIPKFMLYSLPADKDNNPNYPYRLDYAIRVTVQNTSVWEGGPTLTSWLEIDQNYFESSNNRFDLRKYKIPNGEYVWFLYSVKEFIYLINDALARLCVSIYNYIINDSNINQNFITNSPAVIYMKLLENPNNTLDFLIFSDLIGARNKCDGRYFKNGQPVDGPNFRVIFTDALYYLLGKFLARPTTYNFSEGGYFLNNGDNIAREQQLIDYPVGIPFYFESILDDDYDYETEAIVPLVTRWTNDNKTNDLQQMFKIVVEVSEIPIQNTLNGNSTQDGAKYIITFVPDVDQGFHNNYIFKPLNASKLNDILSNYKLNNLSFQFYVLDYLNNRFPIYVPVYKSINLRCLFIKKQLFNNYYQSDTLN